MQNATRRVIALTLALAVTASLSLANVDPKKGRVTDNPTKGNSYSLEQVVQLGKQAVAEINKQLPLLPENHPTSR
jgi:hypothetical protein